MMLKILKTLGYIWALPITLSGLLLALATSKFYKMEGSVFVFESREWFTDLFFDRFLVLAFTWGAVIVVSYGDVPLSKRVMRHELVHFKQACIFGILLPFLYGIGSLIALARGKDPYHDNFLEVWARLES